MHRKTLAVESLTLLVTDNWTLSPVQLSRGCSVQGNVDDEAWVLVGTAAAAAVGESDVAAASAAVVGVPLRMLDVVGTKVIVAVGGIGVFVGGIGVLVGIAAAVWVSIS